MRYKPGVPRQTWQVIAELGQYNYAMEESDEAGMATRYGSEGTVAGHRCCEDHCYTGVICLCLSGRASRGHSRMERFVKFNFLFLLSYIRDLLRSLPSSRAGCFPFRYMATAGFLSPRMKEKELAKLKKSQKLIALEEVCQQSAMYSENSSEEVLKGSCCSFVR